MSIQIHPPRGIRDNEDKELLQTKAVAPDFTAMDPWRVLRIQGEVVEGFDALSKIGPAVAVFGSARLGEEHPYYQAAREPALPGPGGPDGDLRGRPRHYGSGQPRRLRDGHSLGGLRHPALPRADAQPVPDYRPEAPVFFCA